MEKFLEKIQAEIEKKMLSCVRGESIVKPFTQVYEEVREKQKRSSNKQEGKQLRTTKIYTEGEASIYTKVVQEYLAQHPELLQQIEK